LHNPQRLPAKRDKLGPPRFLADEWVRVVEATASGFNEEGEPIEAAALVGAELYVGGARPTLKRDGWLIEVFVQPEGEPRLWFPESALESTGVFGDEDPPEWRDEVRLDLVTSAWENEEGEEFFWRSVEVLRQFLTSQDEDIVGGHDVNVEDEPIAVNLWLYPAGDVVETYQEIISAPERAWTHGEDRRGFPLSRWESPLAEKAVFLVSGIEEAKVTCEHWSTPERLLARSVPRRRPSPRRTHDRP
jgi:hypothetical protein